MAPFASIGPARAAGEATDVADEGDQPDRGPAEPRRRGDDRDLAPARGAWGPGPDGQARVAGRGDRGGGPRSSRAGAAPLVGRVRRGGGLQPAAGRLPHAAEATRQAIPVATSVTIQARPTSCPSVSTRCSTTRSERPAVTVPPFHGTVTVAIRIPGFGCQVTALMPFAWAASRTPFGTAGGFPSSCPSVAREAPAAS